MALVNNSSSSSWQEDASIGVQIATTVIIFLVGVPLNGLVVWALGCRTPARLARRGSLNEETRAANSFRVYVLNLALADLVLLLRTPLMLGYLVHELSWPFGIGLCRIVMFLRGLGLYAAAFLLCAVALERCLCLLRPVWARLRRPSWAVPVTCSVLWAVATGLAAPYFYTSELMEWEGKYHCLESLKPQTWLFVTETVVGFILPLLMFLGSNVAVLVAVSKAQLPTPTANSSSHRMTRLYQVLFLTMLLFLTCWVPYFCCRFVEAIASRQRPQLEGLYNDARYGKYIALYFVYIKSALNPVLYVFAARGLSRAVKASLVSTIERVFNDESSESIRRKSLKQGNSQL